MTTKFKQFLLFFMVLLLSAGQVMAQDNRAVISGIVTDETGMGVIGAAIQVKNESTGFNTGSITNENGEYTIKQLPLGGPYSITVTYVGYGDQKKTGYTLNQGDLLRLDFQLKEESVVMEAVEVVANSLTLNPQLHSRSATYKRNGLLIRKTAIKSSRPFQCAYYPLTP